MTAYAGFLLGAFALGSVAGGLWFGRQPWLRPPQQRYLLAAEALGTAAGAAAAGAASVWLGTWAPFAIASVVLAVPAAAALLWQRATVQAPKPNTG